MPDRNGSESQVLVQNAAAGDQRARSKLLEHYRESLRRMIAIRIDRRVAARIDASDIVQETLQHAHVRMGDYFSNPEIPFFPWLRRIACDRLVDAYRTHVETERRSVRREWTLTLDVSDGSLDDLACHLAASSLGPDQRAIQAEASVRTRAALMELKPADREILVLRYLEQLSVDEIANALGISHTAVTSRHLRSLQRLRRLLVNEAES
jgi:RNA polymerase sigma-70 factor (ECF subfamily)